MSVPAEVEPNLRSSEERRECAELSTRVREPMGEHRHRLPLSVDLDVEGRIPCHDLGHPRGYSMATRSSWGANWSRIRRAQPATTAVSPRKIAPDTSRITRVRAELFSTHANERISAGTM